MREIKFRAWHKIKMKMFSAGTMTTDQLTLLPTGNFINVSGADTQASTILHSMIPLQYIGVKDKNGKEIYEGDYIRCCVDDDCSIHSVEWGGENHNCYPAFDLVPDAELESNGISYFHSTGTIEVVGNIYENKVALGEVK